MRPGLRLKRFAAVGLVVLAGAIPANGVAPAEKGAVDLRSRFFELGLYAPNQGRRPSCSVFAILSVLEFHHSITGNAVRLSEEYLLWATRQVNPHRTNWDGFTFDEVLTAAARFGLAPADAVPNRVGEPDQPIVIPDDIQASAMSRRHFSVVRPSGSNNEKLAAIVRELNRGYPVAVALRWPTEAVAARVHTLRSQKPREDAGHAVTIVGYEAADGAGEENLFLFRNSYGPRWGVAGHGYASESYLKENLLDVVLIRLTP